MSHLIKTLSHITPTKDDLMNILVRIHLVCRSEKLKKKLMTFIFLFIQKLF